MDSARCSHHGEEILRSRVLVVASCATLGVACGNVLWLVEERAPRDLACPDVEFRERSSGVVVARGCGQTAVYQCHAWDNKCDSLTEFARARASREARCAPFKLTVAEVHPHLFQVSGCGTRGVYFCEMKDGITTCVNEANLQRR